MTLPFTLPVNRKLSLLLPPPPAFVKHVCSGSLEAVESEKKTIMMPSHVLASLESRGFGSIAAELRQKEAKLITGEKKKKKDTGMTEQEMVSLIRFQSPISNPQELY